MSKTIDKLDRKDPIPFKWEPIGSGVHRAKVFGGWVLSATAETENETMVFIPDPNHEWRVE